MKNFTIHITLSFLCLIVFFNDCHSQNYHPMPHSNAVWREYYVGNPGDFPNQFDVYEYFLDGDTLIGNYLYQRVRFYAIAMSGDTVPSNEQFFYRQDTIDKKVYIQNIFYPFNDTLIYDFSVQLGDILKDILYSDCCIWVDQIDSILTPIGWLKRIRLTSASFGKGYWIEGIGNINGFFGHPFYLPFAPLRKIICFKHYGITIYDAPVVEADCDSLYIGIIEVNTNNGMQVYPNPVKKGESINIHFDSLSEGTLFISDLLNGRIAELKVARGTGTTAYQFESSGIYMLLYRSQHNSWRFSKLMVIP